MIRRWLIVCALAIAPGCWAWADTLPLNQQPMFGGQEKNAAMKAADFELMLLAKELKSGGVSVGLNKIA